MYTNIYTYTNIYLRTLTRIPIFKQNSSEFYQALEVSKGNSEYKGKLCRRKERLKAIAKKRNKLMGESLTQLSKLLLFYSVECCFVHS